MAEPLTAGMPADMDIGGGYTIRLTAVDATTGNTVANVNVSGGRIYATVVEGTVGNGGGTIGPFMLVPGPGA